MFFGEELIAVLFSHIFDEGLPGNRGFSSENILKIYHFPLAFLRFTLISLQ